MAEKEGLLPFKLIEGRKQWAEVEFIASAASVKKDMKPDRYLAIRVRPAQGDLFSDGNSYHYYAVVTNRWEMDGEELLQKPFIPFF